MKPIVVLSDIVDQKGDIERALLEPFAEVRSCTSDNLPALLDAVHDATAVITSRTQFNETLLDRMHYCKVIVRTGVGVDNISLPHAKAKGITVCNVPHYCADEVADHTVALMLALLRKIVVAARATRDGHWLTSDDLTPLARISGLTLGMIGFGHIAREVARRALAFKIRLIVSDPFVSAEEITAAHAVKVDLDTLYRDADIVSVHLPLTHETHHLIGGDVLAAMKSSAILVNTSRGPVVDVAALIRALDDGQIAGAALDVLEQEPPGDFNTLQRDNLIVTPHMAYFSDQAQVSLRTQSAQEVLRVLRGETPHNPVYPLPLKSS